MPQRIRLGYRFVGLDLKTSTWAAMDLVAQEREVDTAVIAREIFREWASRLPAELVERARVKAEEIEADQRAALEARERKRRGTAPPVADTPAGSQGA